MIRRPPRSKRTDTLFPYTTLFRSSLVCRITSTYQFAFTRSFASPRTIRGRGSPWEMMGHHGENLDVMEAKNKLRLQSGTGSEQLPSSKALATVPRCAECRAGCLVNVDVLVLFQITLPVSRGRAPGLRRYANCRRRKPDGL